MKDYQPVKTGWELEKYKQAIKEGKEDEVFLGDGEFMIRHRESFFEGITDMEVLIRYCLFPLYEEGDRDIVRRTENILKDFVASGEINKLYQVLSYFSVQSSLIEHFTNLPFFIDISVYLRNILENVVNLANTKGDKKFSLIINWISQFPEFREYDNEVVENILSIRRELANKPQVVPSLEEIFPIELDPTKIDSIGVVENHLEMLLLDSNKWRKPLEKQHLLKLQEKLNNYIHFIESKQYVDSYGDDFTEKVINLTFQYAPSDNGLAFLVQVQKVLQPTDIRLKVVVPE
ncbi:NAD glycohydrolase toxin immunity factor [Streptococcus suis]|uniref:Uncharacterized protein n=3 Tax=Streptococcus suis TaxID=1307 RepID=A0A540UPH2_STRSU|nr:NAD glycohydrolase toxin immunity factor [Streptococcus suis]MBS0687223.1 hypothetical protein [Streptococcus suis]MBS0714018.1 hypothetical protein [Streptococcus suis]MDW8710388.1 NAD glycohydrolase toxin immunity factor [Streptococcus suis]TQE86402.1 hypothetical protein FH692_10505 [Streptococcus suis]HEM5251590.1 hypothetical protein [Streptococcus suis]